jgi:hypothetical protein
MHDAVLHGRTPLIPISFDTKTSSIMGKGITPIGRASQPSEVRHDLTCWSCMFQFGQLHTMCTTSYQHAVASALQLAPAFVLLASDEASYMTGSILACTGGMYAN